MEKLHDKARVSSRPSLYMLAEVAGGGSNKSRFCKPRVSVSSPWIKCFELNLLADVAAGSDFYCSLFSGELTEVEKGTRPRKLEMLAEVAGGDYGGSNKSRFCRPRVSVSSPCFELNMLADVATSSDFCYSLFSGELTEVEKATGPRKLEMLAYVAASSYDKEYGGKENKSNTLDEAKLIINFVKVPRKKRSLRQQSKSIINCVKVPRKKRSFRQQSSSSHTVATIRWIDCLIQPQKPNPEPSPSTSYSVSKKRGSVNVSEEEEMRNRKKRKTVGRRVDPTPTRTVPEWLVKVMAREGNGYDPKLIIARKLYKSDLDKGQARLSMPLKQVLSKDFLTEEEKRMIDEHSVTKSRSNGLSVVLVDPLLNKHKVDLRKWEMRGNWNYVFVDGWNDVVAKNKFEIGDVYPVWSFRSGGGKLCFALIPQSSDGNSPPA